MQQQKNIIRISIITAMALLSIYSYGQVTVGSGLAPEKAALLDIKTLNSNTGGATTTEGGVLLPRMYLDNINELAGVAGIKASDSDYSQQKLRHKGLMIYNLNTAIADEGLYIWNGNKWQKAGGDVQLPPEWFYMPSISIDAKTTGNNKTVNLHSAYLAQFNTTTTPRSPGAPALPVYTNPESLHYYVIGYDTNVFQIVSINARGVMTYNVLSPAVDGSSYINIVFMSK